MLCWALVGYVGWELVVNYAGVVFVDGRVLDGRKGLRWKRQLESCRCPIVVWWLIESRAPFAVSIEAVTNSITQPVANALVKHVRSCKLSGS